MLTNSQKVSAFRRRRKENLIKVCGEKCAICGYNKLPAALEFHHIKPENKSYGIAQNGTCHNLEQDLTEVKKCILVCANCHREIHADLYCEEELLQYQIFNENFANILRAERQFEKPKCSECGKELYEKTKTGLCQECYRKKTSIENIIDRETLKDLIYTTSFLQIGKQYGVSDNAIRKWCIKFGLPSKKSEINKIPYEEWIKI